MEFNICFSCFLLKYYFLIGWMLFRNIIYFLMFFDSFLNHFELLLFDLICLFLHLIFFLFHLLNLIEHTACHFISLIGQK
jgi:hypothetical protein